MKILKEIQDLKSGLGYVISSYSSLGFRALPKHADWTPAGTAEHLSGY